MRLVTPEDAGPLARLLVANRRFLEPWEPLRADGYFTEAGQQQILHEALRQHECGRLLPCVILRGGTIAGRITVNNIVRASFCSGDLGYWVSRAENGRGVATEAVAAVVATAFADAGLHRLQAATLVHNVGSQRVLARNGFTEIGRAPGYLKIAGRWQEHVLFQRVDACAPDLHEDGDLSPRPSPDAT